MNYYAKPLPHLENAESSQLTDYWDLMHIVHDVQHRPLMQVKKFSYLHTKTKR